MVPPPLRRIKPFQRFFDGHGGCSSVGLGKVAALGICLLYLKFGGCGVCFGVDGGSEAICLRASSPTVGGGMRSIFAFRFSCVNGGTWLSPTTGFVYRLLPPSQNICTC
jgi:hypothetical protein